MIIKVLSLRSNPIISLTETEKISAMKLKNFHFLCNFFSENCSSAHYLGLGIVLDSLNT